MASFLKTGSRLATAFCYRRREGGTFLRGRQQWLTIPTASYRKIAFKEPTMDDLPVPQGSWEAAAKKQQSKNNQQLLIGGSFFVFTLLVVFTSGIVQFNATVPKLPSELVTKGGKCGPPPPPKC